MCSEQLIMSVYNRRVLWDASHPDHRNRYVLDRLCSEVGNENEITGKTLLKTLQCYMIINVKTSYILNIFNWESI